jgi:regulator of sigma E protease
MAHVLFVTAWLLIVLGIMVFVHELGHFIVAKLFGVRIETFSLGFGKRLFGFRRGDTDYRVSLLPLGGYVKMAGELGGDGAPIQQASPSVGGPPLAAAAVGEEELLNNTILAPSHPGGDPGDLNSKPRWQRILIALAGPFANFILALVLMTFVFMTHHEIPEYVYQPAKLDYVPPASPAATAGFHSGDRIVLFDDMADPTWEQVGERAALNVNRIVSVTVERNGERIPLRLPIETRGHRDELDFQYLGLLPLQQSGPLQIADVASQFPAAEAGIHAGDKIVAINDTPVHSTESVAAYLQTLGGAPVTVTVLRKSEQLRFNVTPKLTDDEYGQKVYRLGFKPVPPPTRSEKLSLPAAFAASAKDNLRNASLIGEVLHRMLTLRMSVRTLSGPVGIGQQVGQAAAMPGWTPLIQVMAFISINLGIFNLLPIPILDGGVVLFLLIESVMRRDLNQHFKERIYQTAFVFLLIFAVLVVANDISKLGLFTHGRP